MNSQSQNGTCYIPARTAIAGLSTYQATEKQILKQRWTNLQPLYFFPGWGVLCRWYCLRWGVLKQVQTGRGRSESFQTGRGETSPNGAWRAAGANVATAK